MVNKDVLQYVVKNGLSNDLSLYRYSVNSLLKTQIKSTTNKIIDPQVIRYTFTVIPVHHFSDHHIRPKRTQIND